MISFLPEYSNSFALCIGVNKYKYAGPLGYAENDAKAISKTLIEKFEFPKKNVRILLNEKATAKNIMLKFLKFAREDIVSPDDRILIFFAGHGHTESGYRGEVGYLVPYDGNVDELSSLIRWDDLTKNAELIPAKHILFIMDACYGGLAVLRFQKKGSMRYLGDMLSRLSRQAIAAGKANEPVADAGGPVPNHSIFTGHLLNALDGDAAFPNETLTAQGVMQYVYQKVSMDQNSNQTPHYGHLHGDGDFVFYAPELNSLNEDPKTQKDILIQQTTVPGDTTNEEVDELTRTIKRFLSGTKNKIDFEDYIIRELKKVIQDCKSDKYSINYHDRSAEKIAQRLKNYEDSVKNLKTIIICIMRWGNHEHINLVEMILSRISDSIPQESGYILWKSLCWYPIILFFYYGGIASLSSENYQLLYALFNTKVTDLSERSRVGNIIMPVGQAFLSLFRQEAFKKLPNHERFFTPHSEYLLKLVQPFLEDILFLGNSYETLFDQFEIMLALTHADLFYKKNNYIWTPPGRFVWKHRRYPEDSTLTQVKNEAFSSGDSWKPLKAGFFESKFQRFKTIVDLYENDIRQLNWH